MCEQNEWDSDIEDSNSSEEFMYVRNVSPPTRMKHEDMAVNFNKETSTDEYSDNSTHQYNPSNSVWNSHEDKVQIMNKGMNACKIDTKSSIIVFFVLLFNADL